MEDGTEKAARESIEGDAASSQEKKHGKDNCRGLFEEGG
jgi:hypothetical protein